MNPTQKRTLQIGVFFMVLMGLFPPWQAKVDTDSFHFQSGIGYGFLATPPDSDLLNLSFGEDKVVRAVDWVRLVAQWSMVLVFLVFVVIMFRQYRH
jgi:hypothetical protein